MGEKSVQIVSIGISILINTAVFAQSRFEIKKTPYWGAIERIKNEIDHYDIELNKYPDLVFYHATMGCFSTYKVYFLKKEVIVDYKIENHEITNEFNPTNWNRIVLKGIAKFNPKLFNNLDSTWCVDCDSYVVFYRNGSVNYLIKFYEPKENSSRAIIEYLTMIEQGVLKYSDRK